MDVDLIHEKVKKKNILVIGDIMIDEYHFCNIEKKTPEGPFLVWDLQKIFKKVGGAGNIASFLSIFGPSIELAGISLGDEVSNLANLEGIKCVLVSDGRINTIKRRFVDIETKMLVGREDIEKKDNLSKETADLLFSKLKKSYDAVIFADYAKGVFNENTVDIFTSINAKFSIADVKPQNVDFFKSKVNIIKMNFKEFKTTAEKQNFLIKNSDADIEKFGMMIRDSLKTDLLITRGREGMSYIGEEVIHMKSDVKEVVDVVGAGDVVTAMFVAGLLADLDLSSTMYFANKVASFKVTRHSSSLISYKDIKNIFTIRNEEDKLIDYKKINEVVITHRSRNHKIVFTNGCFDILHHGHTYFLKKAKELGDILIVGLNSDSSVKKLKGPNRPKLAASSRAKILAALPVVDYIVIFDDDTAEHLVSLIKPDVYVKGADYEIKKLPEANLVEKYGGRVVLIPLLTENGKKISSSDIVNS